MDRRNLVIVILAAALVAFSIADRRDPAIAAEAAALANVPPTLQVVAYGSGLTGFFDPTAKKLYLYGADLKTPFMTAEIDELGKPLKVTQLAK